MKDLIELFFSAPLNEHQEIYRDYEASFMSGLETPTYCRLKMREELECWIDSQLNKYNMEVSLLNGCFVLSYEKRDIEITFEDTAKLITIIEACQKDDFSAISEAVKQL